MNSKSIGISPLCPKINANTPSPTLTSVVATGQVSTTPTATVICVNGTVSTLAGKLQTTGYTDGTGILASFNTPLGITTDASGNIYVADAFNNLIRKITSDGVVTTLAGSGTVGSSDGTGSSASFNQPWGVATDTSGNIYVIDSGNNLVRKITSTGVVTTLATGQEYCYGIAADTSGNVYVACESLCSYLAGIRKITPDGTVSNLVTGVAFSHIAVDGSGNLYATMDYNVYKIVSGSAVLLAGSGTQGYVDGLGTAASFGGLSSITVDSLGNIFVADNGNNAIREITPAGMVSTFAGQTGNTGSTNGAALSASFNHPNGLAFDYSGSLYISDTYNQLIRKIQPCAK
jgi:sugar lactone lactonase YvrE